MRGKKKKEVGDQFLSSVYQSRMRGGGANVSEGLQVVCVCDCEKAPV